MIIDDEYSTQCLCFNLFLFLIVFVNKIIELTNRFAFFAASSVSFSSFFSSSRSTLILYTMKSEQIFTITQPNSREQISNRIKSRCSVCLIYFWIIFIVLVPSSGIIIGFLYRNQCSLERHISLWEIINGFITLFFLFLIYLTQQLSTDKHIGHQILTHFQDRHWSLFIFDQLKVLCILFLFAWFICGNVRDTTMTFHCFSSLG